MVAVAVHGWRQPQHGRADPAVSQRQRELRRLPAQLRAAAVLGRRRAVPVPFGRHPARGYPERPGRDDERPARAGQHLAKRLDGLAVRAGRALEAAGERDVVLEREVDHTVRGRRRAAQHVEVIERAALHFGAGGAEGGGRRVRAGQPGDLMARIDELRNEGRANPARRAGDENSHENDLLG